MSPYQVAGKARAVGFGDSQLERRVLHLRQHATVLALDNLNVERCAYLKSLAIVPFSSFSGGQVLHSHVGNELSFRVFVVAIDPFRDAQWRKAMAVGCAHCDLEAVILPTTVFYSSSPLRDDSTNAKPYDRRRSP